MPGRSAIQHEEVTVPVCPPELLRGDGTAALTAVFSTFFSFRALGLTLVLGADFFLFLPIFLAVAHRHLFWE